MENKELTILAVDDIYDNLITLKALILEAFPDANVIYSLSGSDALYLAEQIHPDVILLDVVMPEMDGFEVCRRLKESKYLNDIPVVFITALKGDKDSRIKGLEVGAEAFLAKPIDESELIAQIRAMSKIRQANLQKRREQEALSNILSEKTLQLELNNVATLNLLEDLQREVVARRKTQEELSRSEARLRRAELASKSGNWELNVETNQIYLSEGAVFLLGLNDNAIDYYSFVNLFNPKDKVTLDKSFSRLINEDIPFNFELNLLPHGAKEYIGVRIFAIKEKSDDVIFGVIRNITDQITIREKLSQSEQKYKSIFETSPVGIVYFNSDGVIQDCNQNFVQIIGSSRKVLIGLNLLQFEHNELSKCIRKSLTGQTAVFEGYYNSETADKVTFIRATITPIFSNNNIIESGVGIIWDLTDRKKAEEKIIRSEYEFRLLWENSANALRLTDAHGNIKRVNKAFCQLFGIKESDVVGINMSNLYHDSVEKIELNNYQNKFKNNLLDAGHEKLILLKNGQSKWVEIDKTFIETSKDEKLMLTIFNEITKRKLAEFELKTALDRNHALLQANPDMMFLFNKDYQIIDYNADRELYSEPEYFLNRNIDEVLPPNISNKTKQCIDEVLQTGKIVYHNYELSKDGKSASFEARYVQCDEHALTFVRDVTASVETQKALVESEEKFRNLMDNSPEGITIYIDGIIVYINKEAINIMRAKDKAELIGKPISDFIHPDNLNVIYERLKYVEMAPYNMALPSVEEKYIRIDGSEVDVEIKAMRILYEGKDAVQISGHDITEKKQAREELEKNRKELKAIYDNAPVMMCVVNENAEILFANSALNNFIDDPLKLTNLNTKCGNVFGCISAAENNEGCGFGERCKSCSLRNAISNTFKTGLEHNDIDYQTTVMRDDVEIEISFLASTSLISSQGDKRLLLCMVDITARKEAEEALYKSEMLLRTFIENIPFGVWARDLYNVGIIENTKMRQNFGSIIGTNLESEDKINAFNLEKWKKTNERAYAGEIVNEEVIYIVDGEEVPFQNIVFPIKSDDKIFGIAGININISDRIKAQAELMEYQKQLKDFAVHLQSVREEERIDLAREIHDDLGQILVAIKFDIGMLGVKSKKFIRDEAVEEFTKQFKRLEGYVNNTIKSARRIMSDLRPELLDMIGLVEAFKEHITQFNDRQLIKCQFINKTSGVILPPEKGIALFRILQESLNNASKYSEATEIKVELGSVLDKIYLDIKDNGKGFDMNERKRRDSYGLLGMKERAYLLEGKVDIWSEPGKGTNVYVEIPNPKE